MTNQKSDTNFIELNYKDIGVRVKAERERQGIKQDRLAEMTGFSLTHMSHIETANTKLSLPALHKVAWALGVSMDYLACDSVAKAKEIFIDELLSHTQDCDETEIRIIVDTIKALKTSLRKRERRGE